MKLGGKSITEAFLPSGPWSAFRNGIRIYSYDPVNPMVIGPNSIDVTLSNQFMTVGASHDQTGRWYIDVHDQRTLTTRDCPRDYIILKRGEFILGCTQERFNCSAEHEGGYWCQQLDGRSTIGRLGIGIHVTAGFGDYGFCGRFTLELFNCGPADVQLWQGMRIGQVSFEQVLKPIPYKGAYSCPDHNFKPIGPIIGKNRM